VPLEHRYFERSKGVCTRKQLISLYKRLRGQKREQVAETTHLDLVEHLSKRLLPCLFFAFSRKKCEINAREAGARFSFADEPGHIARVNEVIRRVMADYGKVGRERVEEIKELLYKGIGFHHAGLLPVVKDIMEELFQERLLSVLYCTETFAVGLNFPCRTVCFDSMTKYDGEDFRPLTNREYFQMAGRAGRRGIDEQGSVFTLVNMRWFDPKEVPERDEDEIEPLRSRFTLSYNSVLNLVRQYSESKIEQILGNSFATFQVGQARERIHKELADRYERRFPTGNGCPDFRSERCPLEYTKVCQRLQKARQRLDNIPRNRRTRSRRKSLREEIKRLDRIVSLSDFKHCSKRRQEECRDRVRAARRNEAQIRKLEKRLDSLPSDDRFMHEFKEKKYLLAGLDYIRGDELTARGMFAAEIHTQELLVTELFFDGVFHDFDVNQICALVVAIDYEPRRGEQAVKVKAYDRARVLKHLHHIQHWEHRYLRSSTVVYNEHMAGLAYRWSKGEQFTVLLSDTNADEGDVIYAFRRGIDLLRQVRGAAAGDDSLQTKLSRCIGRMDRDEVSIVL